MLVVKDMFERTPVRFLRACQNRVTDFIKASLIQYMGNGNFDETLEKLVQFIQLIEQRIHDKSDLINTMVTEMSQM